jgi:hypothetical protein
MGRSDLIGNGRHQLIPTYQPIGTGQAHEGRRAPGRRQPAATGSAPRGARPFRTQHTGLPTVPDPEPHPA